MGSAGAPDTGGTAPAGKVAVTGIVACVGIPNVMLSSGGTSVPGANGGGPVGAGARVELEVVVAPGADEEGVVERAEEGAAGAAEEEGAAAEDEGDEDEEVPCRLWATARCWCTLASPATARAEETSAMRAKTAWRFMFCEGEW